MKSGKDATLTIIVSILCSGFYYKIHVSARLPFMIRLAEQKRNSVIMICDLRFIFTALTK